LAGRALIKGSSGLTLSTASYIQYPILKPLLELYNKLTKYGNKYDVYRTFVEIDPELYGALNRLALMVRHSYQGIGVAFGKQLDPKEEELLRIVTSLERKWKFRDLFYSVAFHLLRDGDDIYAIKMKPLPIPYVTIVEDRSQIGNPGVQIFEPNFYVLNELSQSLEVGRQQIWTKDEIVHFSLNNKAELIYDTVGRLTFGVWSLSPLEPLKSRLYWKLAALIDDIILRHRLVPREHHKLDLSAFDPNLFAGETLDDRIRAAKEAAQKHIAEYKQNIVKPLKEVDKSYITGKDVEITYVEPRHVTYVDPNPLLEQISRSIIATVGAPEAAVTGRGRGTYATELVVASYATLCAEALADIIKERVVELVRRAIRAKYPGKFTDEDLNKIDIRIKLMLGFEKSEAARRAAVLKASGIATIEELRNEVGLLRPLTDEEKQQLETLQISGRKIAERTQADIVSDYIRRVQEPEPVTPESEHQRKQT